MSRRAAHEDERDFVNGGRVGYWYYTYDNGGRADTSCNHPDGTTTFAYDSANRLTQKTKGNGDYETYAYDAADQMTGIGILGGGTLERSDYTYDSGRQGQPHATRAATPYGYDGADQQTSETAAAALRLPPMATPTTTTATA